MNRELKDKYNLCSHWIVEIENNTPNSLYAIMQKHRAMWADGVQHESFGPSKYGYFRVDSIDNLSLDTLYIGVKGGCSRNASFFEQNDIKYVSNTVCLSDEYVGLCKYYRMFLLENLKAMRSNIYDHGYNRDKVCENIINGFSAIHPQYSISQLKILNESMADNKVLDVEFNSKGRIIKSTVVNIDGEFYIPEGFEKGVRLNPSKIETYNLQSLYDALNGNEWYRQFSKNELKSEIIADKKSEMSHKTAKDNVKHIANYSKAKGVKFGM